MANADRSGGSGRVPPPPGGREPPRRKQRSPLGAIGYWTAVLGVWGLIFVVAFVAVFARGLPDTSKLYEIHKNPSVSYLDRNGLLISVRGSQYAPPVDLDKLPPYVPAAFVAIEDRRFYQHWGFDVVGMGRALVRDIRHHRTAEGASTITQQLARNLFLTPDQNIRRKVQELLLATWLERKFSKQQILALYLNRVYFGAGAYGVEAAAERFFNKPASRLSVGEAALLAGLLKSPTHYSPINDQERAGTRATIVLDKMVETGAITAAQRDQALKSPLQVSPSLASQHALYFVDWVDGQVRQILGQLGEPQTDLVVETTLDMPIDTAAEAAANSVVARQAAQGVKQAAVVALDGEGRVRALIGGVNYADSQFNRAVDARRQAGSAWKPFVYLTAMEAGRTPDTPVVDEPVTINGWTPHNYTNTYIGPTTLQTALAQSLNTVAAKLADEVGRSNVAATARRLGITSPINTDPAMALGTSQVSPLEMAQAYAAFSNGGAKAEAWGIERIRTPSGRVLYQHPGPAHAGVIGQPALSYMVRMMRAVIASGTGTKANIPGYDLAGKTGTTSDYRDAWFLGYTGGFTTAVWVGKDDNTPMRKVTGGGAPAEIWRGFMTAALPRLKVQPIPGGSAPAPAPQSGDPVNDLLPNSTANSTGDGQADGAPSQPDDGGDNPDRGPPAGPPPPDRPPPPPQGAPYLM